MFIEQAYKYLHDSWRYLVGLGVIFVAWQVIGGLPLIIGIVLKVIADGGSLLDISDDPADLMSMLDSNLTLFLMLLSFVIGWIGFLIWIKYVHKQPLLSITTARKKVDWGRIWFGFALIGIFAVGSTLVDYFYAAPENYVLQFDLIPFLILAVIAILLIPLQTSFEEYLFRGYLMQGIGIMAGNRWVPLVLTSVIFGGLHFFNPEVDKLGNIIMIYYIGTGFFLGIITLMDDGMELALGFHAANNLITALLVTADWTVFQTNSIFKDIAEPTVGFMAVLPVFIIYPILIFIMAKKYKWTNWKEKLFGKVLTPIPETSELNA